MNVTVTHIVGQNVQTIATVGAMQVRRLRRQLLRLFIVSDTISTRLFCESVKVIQAAMRLKTRLKQKVQKGNQRTIITNLHDAF